MDDGLKETIIAEPEVDFPIVGIGASAGGLEAVTAMFHNIEAGTGMAYVLVLHLDPNHESLMAELLSRKTAITVRQIADGDPIEPDCMHVIPPGYILSIKGGLFTLRQFEEPRGLRRPIDSFFVSLAETQGEKAAAVILSGTGADGSAGLKIIKEFGGVCAVQTPVEARYDGMPSAALATHTIDFDLPADQIVPRLKQFFDGANRPALTANSNDYETALQEIFGELRDAFGHDFGGYKRSTLLRRLERRMQVLEILEIKHYLERLQEQESEKTALFEDFLINVTAFFRDPEHFETLQAKVIRPLVQNSAQSGEIRVWVPGCSSGQEAYTLAMLFAQTCREMERRPLVQIFATDIDPLMIDTARRAEYPAASFPEIPPGCREAYTVGLEGKFEIVKHIREMVRFSAHNLLQDAPYSKIDLISCRNLLIYLGDALQTELLPLFHFSLRPGGHLFLGTSENVTRREELFSPMDQRARIFSRRNVARRGPLNLPLRASTSKPLMRNTDTRMSPEEDFPRNRGLVAGNTTIYEQYAPPFVRVTAEGRIADSSGDLSLFLMSRPGEERTLSALARESVRDVVLPLVADAFREDRRLALQDVEVQSPFGIQRTDIVVHPLKDETAAVIFIVKERLKPVLDEYTVNPSSRDRRIADLQEELQGTRLILKSKVEEIETANEELKSSNEEMMSMNEELQSANEELTTANEELKNKIDELVVANADLDNFLQAADLAMLVLDRGLRIRHATHATQRLLPVSHQDKGRVLDEFNLGFDGFDFIAEARNVIRTGEASAQAVRMDGSDHAFFVRFTPYYFIDGAVEGVTITLTDITEAQVLRERLDQESDRLKLAMQVAHMGFAEHDLATDIVTVDPVMAEQYGVTPGDHIFAQIFPNIVEEDREATREARQKAIAENGDYRVEFRVHAKGRPPRWLRVQGQVRENARGEKRAFASSIEITAEKLETERRELLIREMSHRVKNLFAVVSSLVQTAPKSEAETISFAEDLIGRIAALGDAYDLARKPRGLTGVFLRELLEGILRPHMNGQTLTLDGPETTVGTDKLSTLTLILHELTTNALKYGALREPEGSLVITWSQPDKGGLSVTWQETLPGFAAGADHEDGFGSRLIAVGVRQLDGIFERAFTSDGLRVCITLPEDLENGS